MATKSEKDKQKAVHDKNQMILSALLRDDDNKYCVDCDAKGWKFCTCRAYMIDILSVVQKVQK